MHDDAPAFIAVLSSVSQLLCTLFLKQLQDTIQLEMCFTSTGTAVGNCIRC